MNKENLSITIVLLVISILVVGCGPSSEQSTPSPTATDIPEPSPTAADIPEPSPTAADLPEPSPTATDLPESSPTTMDIPLLSLRHVGHWGSFPHPKIADTSHEIYFGLPDEKGMGYGVMTGLDEPFYFSYRIVSVDGDTLTFDMAEKGKSWVWQDYVEIAEDGQSIGFQGMEFVYLDYKTQP